MSNAAIGPVLQLALQKGGEGVILENAGVRYYDLVDVAGIAPYVAREGGGVYGLTGRGTQAYDRYPAASQNLFNPIKCTKGTFCSPQVPFTYLIQPKCKPYTSGFNVSYWVHTDLPETTTWYNGTFGMDLTPPIFAGDITSYTLNFTTLVSDTLESRTCVFEIGRANVRNSRDPSIHAQVTDFVPYEFDPPVSRDPSLTPLALVFLAVFIKQIALEFVGQAHGLPDSEIVPERGPDVMMSLGGYRGHVTAKDLELYLHRQALGFSVAAAEDFGRNVTGECEGCSFGSVYTFSVVPFLVVCGVCGFIVGLVVWSVCVEYAVAGVWMGDSLTRLLLLSGVWGDRGEGLETEAEKVVDRVVGGDGIGISANGDGVRSRVRIFVDPVL